MGWTYSGDPSASHRDELRFLVGDTKESTPLLQDEEIDYILTMHPGTAGRPNYTGAHFAAVMLVGKFSALVSKSVGSLRLEYGEQQRKYSELADRYRKLAAAGLSGRSIAGPPVLLGGGKPVLGPNASEPDRYGD